MFGYQVHKITVPDETSAPYTFDVEAPEGEFIINVFYDGPADMGNALRNRFGQLPNQWSLIKDGSGNVTGITCSKYPYAYDVYIVTLGACV